MGALEEEQEQAEEDTEDMTASEEMKVGKVRAGD